MQNRPCIADCVQTLCHRFLEKIARRNWGKTSGLILGITGMLMGSAHAQLLHRYDFNTTNDTVGTANGTLVGTATLSGGALVTAGGNGTVSGAWSGTGPRMTLDPSAVAGLTNTFTIETWFACTTGWPKYDSLFAFSDGTTANYLLGNPVMGYSPWPSGCNIAGGGGSSSPSVRGIYLDNNSTHQFVLTFDGTTFTYYIDGAIANFSGYSASAADPGFNLSTLTDVGVNGGSPWGDPTLTGSTYDFRIYGQALTAAQVASIFGLGQDASNASITNALVPPTAFTWNGAGADNNWGTALNWLGGTAPANSGNSITLAGSTRTSPNLQASYSVTGLTFSNNASSFTLGTANGSTLTLAGDVVNYSANAQTFNVPVSIGLPANLNAAAGSLVVNSNITLGASALTLNGNNNFTLNGNITGTGSFTKNGAGALALGGSTLSVGAVSFNGGTASVSGTVSSVGGTTYVGYLTNNGTVNMSGGTWNIGGEMRVGGSDQNGASVIGAGTFNIAGGTVNASALTVARGNYLDNSISGVVNLNGGGTFISSNDVVLQFAGSGLGKLAINGGSTFIIGPTALKWFMVGYYDSGAGELDLTNGNLKLENGSSLKMCRNGNTGGNMINQAGGSVTFYGDAGVTVGGAGVLDMNYAGGSSSSDTYNLLGGTLTVPQITTSSSAGSSTFNFNGGTLKPTASSPAFMQGLISANVMVGGAIIDTTNFNVTIAPTLANGDGFNGGLIKLGSGALTLAGGYTYSGPTVVEGGTLALDASQVSTSISLLNVSNATVSLSLNNGTSTLMAGGVALTGATALNFNFGTATSPSARAIDATGQSVTVTGTNVINIAGQYLVVGQYPLIYTGSSVPTNHFKLGTLPTGLAAVLTNSGASLDLLVTASGQVLTWYGADSSGNPLTTWNINTSSNWNGGNAKYLQYAANSYGDNVTFDDTLFSAADANIGLNTTVVPASVTFNNSSTVYSVTGAGGIGGATTVTMKGSGFTYLGTTNTYSGGTSIGGGILSVVNDQALGTAGAPVALVGGTLQFSNSTASARSITVVSNSLLDLPAGTAVQLSGSISGAAALTKTGLGTLTLAGADSAVSAAVGAGVLNLTGASTNVSVTVGNAAGDAVMHISGALVASNLFVGNASGAMGVASQTGGTVNLNGGTGDNLSIGNWSGSYGYFNAAGGTMNVNGINIGGEQNPNVWPPAGSGDGILEVNGATITNTGWIVLARGGGPNTGILNVYSGSLTYAGGGLACNWELTANNDQTSIVNLMGGSVTSTSQGVNFRSVNTGIVNLNGGLLQGASVTGPGVVNFSGGTLRPSTTFGSPFLSVNNVYVYSGGAKIDDNGQALAISQAFLSPTGYGVSAIVPADGGSGYIAPPIVTISGGTGSNATAIATISAGSISHITVTCPGVGYSSGDTLTVTYSGGGASAVAPASTTVNLAANTSGGLTKLGSGTLTLDGVNTYTGPTIVSSGTLAGVGTIAGAFTNNATLAPGDSGSGSLTVNGNITLNAGSTNAFAVNGTTPANASVVAGANVTYGGVLKIVPTGTFTAGQQFQLFSGAGAANSSNFSSVQGSAGSGLGFAFTNGVLTVVATSTVNANPPQMQVSMSGNTMRLAWPTNAGWILQSNSVGLTAASSWYNYPADGSVGVTNVSITVLPAKPNVFFRMVKP